MTICGSDTNCNVSITVEVTVCKKVTVCHEILCRHRGEGAPGDHTGQEDFPEECTPAGKDVMPGCQLGQTTKRLRYGKDMSSSHRNQFGCNVR